MIMSGARQTVFRPLDPEFLEDPYPIYARLREQHPVAWSSTRAVGYTGFWFVSRYADVAAGLKDNRFGREIAKVMPADAFPPIPPAHKPLYDMLSGWMLFKDPPEHARLRRIAAPVFSLRAVLGMRPRIEALIAAAMARIPESGSYDIVSDFSSPLSIDIVADLMGVPEEDHPLVRGWVREITLSLDLVRTPERIAAGSRRAGELLAYFDRLVAQHRRTPQGNLLSLLIEAHDGGSFLDEHELLAACVLFLFAGHEASSLLIGNGLWALSKNPEQWQRLHVRRDRRPVGGLRALALRQPAADRLPACAGGPDLPGRGDPPGPDGGLRAGLGEPRSRRSSPRPTGSTCSARRTATSRSAPACIPAPAAASPTSRPSWCSRRSAGASRSSRSCRCCARKASWCAVSPNWFFAATDRINLGINRPASRQFDNRPNGHVAQDLGRIG